MPTAILSIMLSPLLYIILFILHNTQEEDIIMFTLRAGSQIERTHRTQSCKSSFGIHIKFVSPIHHIARTRPPFEAV